MLQQRNINEINRNTDSQGEQTNYTKWQRKHYDGISPDEFFAAAKEYDKANPFTGKAKRI